jgi:hypothetical protein
MPDDRFPGMSKDRYKELSTDCQLTLTPEEITAGWHFCYDWDWLLIHSSWEEAQGCTGCNA